MLTHHTAGGVLSIWNFATEFDLLHHPQEVLIDQGETSPLGDTISLPNHLQVTQQSAAFHKTRMVIADRPIASDNHKSTNAHGQKTLW